MNHSLKQTHVVTCLLESEGKILILLRSERVGSYQGKWGGVAGFIETDPDTQAFTEIREETGPTVLGYTTCQESPSHNSRR